MKERPRLVLIAGGSASGKTTLAEALAEKTDALLIAHDRYYLDQPDPGRANFDHPDSLETTLLIEHVDRLLGGRAVDLPVYEFPRHARARQGERVEPRPLILVEGILTLASPGLAERADLRVFVHCDADVRLARRVMRDMTTRGRSAESVITRYLSTVRPAHDAFIEPSRSRAELVLDGGGDLSAALATLEQAVHALRWGGRG